MYRESRVKYVVEYRTNSKLLLLTKLRYKERAQIELVSE